jgi:hypothetical protein
MTVVSLMVWPFWKPPLPVFFSRDAMIAATSVGWSTLEVATGAAGEEDDDDEAAAVVGFTGVSAAPFDSVGAGVAPVEVVVEVAEADLVEEVELVVGVAEEEESVDEGDGVAVALESPFAVVVVAEGVAAASEGEAVASVAVADGEALASVADADAVALALVAEADGDAPASVADADGEAAGSSEPAGVVAPSPLAGVSSSWRFT